MHRDEPALPDVAGRTAVPSARARPPHVLVVVENIPLCVDPRVRKQVRTLLAAGYRVSVITRRDPGNAAYRDLPGLTVLEHPAPPEPGRAIGYLAEYGAAFWWAAVRSLAARLRGPIEVVQLCQPPDIYFPLAWLLRGLGARVVVDQRDLMPEVFASRYGEQSAMTAVLRWLERRTQRAAHYAIGVNTYLRDRLEGAGAARGRVGVVANGPRMAAVTAATPDHAVRKGADFLLCWAGIVRGRGRTGCRFVLLGDGECLDDLRAQVTRLGLDEWVDFPGWVSEERLFAHLAACDVGLDTTLQAEVSPVKAMEYMAFGVPVVAFDLPETAATVRGAGVLVPPGEVGRFADEVVALLDDPSRRTALGHEGRRLLVEDLCWERQAETYVSIIDRAAGVERAAPVSPAAGAAAASHEVPAREDVAS